LAAVEVVRLLLVAEIMVQTPYFQLLPLLAEVEEQTAHRSVIRVGQVVAVEHQLAPQVAPEQPIKVLLAVLALLGQVNTLEVAVEPLKPEIPMHRPLVVTALHRALQDRL
jgi:hypothetical protein